MCRLLGGRFLFSQAIDARRVDLLEALSLQNDCLHVGLLTSLRVFCSLRTAKLLINCVLNIYDVIKMYFYPKSFHSCEAI